MCRKARSYHRCPYRPKRINDEIHDYPRLIGAPSYVRLHSIAPRFRVAQTASPSFDAHYDSRGFSTTYMVHSHHHFRQIHTRHSYLSVTSRRNKPAIFTRLKPHRRNDDMVRNTLACDVTPLPRLPRNAYLRNGSRYPAHQLFRLLSFAAQSIFI